MAADKDTPNWLYRVEEDEMRTLMRASANYARQGFDPALATLQGKGKSQRRSHSRGKGGKSDRKFENNFIGGVPTHYRSHTTGRTLTTELPSVRPSTRGERAPEPESSELRAVTREAQRAGLSSRNAKGRDAEAEAFAAMGIEHDDPMRGLHPSRIPLAKTKQLTYHAVEAQNVRMPAHMRQPGPTAASVGLGGGLSKAAQAAMADTSGEDQRVPRPSDVLKRYKLFNVRPTDAEIGKRTLGMLGTEGGRHPDQGASNIFPGTIVTEQRNALMSSGTALNMFPPSGSQPASTLPSGAATFAIQQNRLGKAGVAPMPIPRGGSGLVVGDIKVSHSQLTPASLVVSKWGRLADTKYGAHVNAPCTITLELQPIYLESFLMDMHTVLDRTGGFDWQPLVKPGAFLVDFGTVNARVHGHDMPEALESAAGAAMHPSNQGFGEGAGGQMLAIKDGSATGGPPASAPPPGTGAVSLEGATPATPRLPPGQMSDSKFSLGDVGWAGRKGTLYGQELEQDELRKAKQRVARRSKPKPLPTAADVARAELSMAVDNAKEKAARLIFKLAEDGNATALEVLLKDGLKVEYEPNPVYAREAAQAAAKTSQAKAAMQDSSGAPSLGGMGRADTADRDLFHEPIPPPPRKDIFVMPDVDDADFDGYTPLMMACRNGWTDAALVLLRNGADHKRRNAIGQSCLDLAKAESATASIALSVNIPGAAQRKRRAAKLASLLDDRTVLVCAQKGDMRRIEYLVSDCHHPVNATNAYGMTPLHFCVLRRDAKMAKFLVNRGADTHARNNLGQSPLSLTLEMMRDPKQAHLLQALDSGDLATAQDMHDARAAEEAAMAKQAAEEKLVSQLKTYSKGTSAARAIYSALGNVGKAGTKADFGSVGVHPQNDMKVAKGGFQAPALTKALGMDTTGKGGKAKLGPLKFQPISNNDRLKALASPAGLNEAWNRHMLNFIATNTKQSYSADARAAREVHEAEDVAASEVRAGRMNPGHIGEFVSDRAAAVQRPYVPNDPDTAIRSSTTRERLVTDNVPPADSGRFEAWARMRFG